jgi:hypothetical protein
MEHSRLLSDPSSFAAAALLLRYWLSRRLAARLPISEAGGQMWKDLIRTWLPSEANELTLRLSFVSSSTRFERRGSSLFHRSNVFLIEKSSGLEMRKNSCPPLLYEILQRCFKGVEVSQQHLQKAWNR